MATRQHFAHAQLSIKVRVLIWRIIFSVAYIEKIDCSRHKKIPLVDRFGSGVRDSASFCDRRCGKHTAATSVSNWDSQTLLTTPDGHAAGNVQSRINTW